MNRKPNELHVLHGTDRKDRGTNNVFKIPDNLCKDYKYVKDATARELASTFKEVKSWIEQRTGLCSIDRILVSQIIDLLKVYHYSKNKLLMMQDGDRINYDPKLARRHHIMMVDSAKQIISVMNQYGMTPQTRSNFSMVPKDNDEVSDILSKIAANAG